MRTTVIKHEAADRKTGMTVAELDAFLHAVINTDDIATAGFLVKVRTTWRGTIRSAQVAIEKGP